MKIGQVIGSVWATRKVKTLEGCKLLIVQPIRHDGQPQGDALVAADPKNFAGVGDRVIYVTNREAVDALIGESAPINASIGALIDSIE